MNMILMLTLLILIVFNSLVLACTLYTYRSFKKAQKHYLESTKDNIIEINDNIYDKYKNRDGLYSTKRRES
jgi:cbb3-type cytochrome oxidase subunit 3